MDYETNMKRLSTLPKDRWREVYDELAAELDLQVDTIIELSIPQEQCLYIDGEYRVSVKQVLDWANENTSVDLGTIYISCDFDEGCPAIISTTVEDYETWYANMVEHVEIYMQEKEENESHKRREYEEIKSRYLTLKEKYEPAPVVTTKIIL